MHMRSHRSLYSGGRGFKFRLGDRIVRLVTAFLRPFSNLTGQFIRFRHDSFLNATFQHHYSVTNRDSDSDSDNDSQSSRACSYGTEPFAHNTYPRTNTCVCRTLVMILHTDVCCLVMFTLALQDARAPS